MDIAKFALCRRNGFGYVETLLALLLFSVGALGLMQTSLNHSNAIQSLSSQLLSQQLLLTIENRLRVNKAYLRKSRQSSEYFSSVYTQQKCDLTVGHKCNSQICSDSELAKQDLYELNCLAQEAGVEYQLSLTSAAIAVNYIEVLISIWHSSPLCAEVKCKALERSIYL